MKYKIRPYRAKKLIINTLKEILLMSIELTNQEIFQLQDCKHTMN